MNNLELKIPPLALVVAVAVAMWAASIFFSTASLSLPVATILAIALAGVGSGIAVAGVSAFRKHRTTVNPMKPETTGSIVTTGIYRATRNPMYLGFAFILLGWAAYLENLVALMLVPAFMAYMTQFQIKPEERALLAKFGPSFAGYLATVRRWL